MKKSHWKTLSFSAVAIMALSACASEPEENGEGNNAEGESNNLIIGTASDITNLDPHLSNDVPSSNVQANIFETLLTQDVDGELHPNLATDWEQTEDNTWEFQLREDVTFTDGTDFNAEAVAATMDRVLDEDIASQRAFLYEMVEEVNIVDNYTVEFVTEYPFAPLPAHLAHSGGGIISPTAIEEDYAMMEEGNEPGSYIGENPIGTGMLMLNEWDTGNEVVLDTNEDYWGDVPSFDSATFRVIPEDLTRIGELQDGNIHIIEPIPSDSMDQIENNENATLVRTESLGLDYIGFNTQKEPFDDERVRQALSMAINKETIVDGVLNGAGVVAESPINQNVFGYSENVDGLEYDPEAAQELLAEAGYEDGFSTTLWTNDETTRQNISEVAQQNLAEIGVEVDVEVREWGSFLDSTAQGDHDMFILGWSTVTSDADYGMYPLFHSSSVGAPGNRSFLEDDEVDEVLESARQETDENTRLELYEEAQNLLVEKAPMVYLDHDEHISAHLNSVQGYEMHPNGIYQLQNVSLNNE